MSSAPEQVAARLTPKQRAVLLSLPDDGEFGKAADARCARRMWWGIQKGGEVRLIEHEHCTDNSWCLNARGLRVRAEVEKE